MLHAYVAQLKKYAEEKRAKEQARREERARAEAKAARERLTPQDERLARLLVTIPVEVQREGVLFGVAAGFVARPIARQLSPRRVRTCVGQGRVRATAGLAQERRWLSSALIQGLLKARPLRRQACAIIAIASRRPRLRIDLAQ